MKAKWYYLRLRYKFRHLLFAAGQEMWLVVADVCWSFPSYREAYYAHRQRAWRSAEPYLPFALWLKRGGWKAVWRKNDDK